MSEVVGSGWTHATFLRTVGVGSPGLASLTPLSGGGRGPSRVLFFVILSHRSVSSEHNAPNRTLLGIALTSKRKQFRWGNSVGLVRAFDAVFLNEDDGREPIQSDLGRTLRSLRIQPRVVGP